MSQSKNPSKGPVIAIDGPGGSGKGTISKRVAAHLGWAYLDSGALYRGLALAADDAGIGYGDEEQLSRLALDLDIHFSAEVENDEVYLNGEEVGVALRSEKTGDAASQVAALPKVREALLQRQRDFRVAPGLVADGRDMGSHVFTDAEAKIYLTASAEERAKRRYNQLKEKGLSASLPSLFEEIALRDERDAGRSVSPLVNAPDAEIIDTTGMGVDEVVVKVLALASERIGNS